MPLFSCSYFEEKVAECDFHRVILNMVYINSSNIGSICYKKGTYCNILCFFYLYHMIRIPSLVEGDLNVSVAQDRLLWSTGFSLVQQIYQRKHFVSGKYMRTSGIIDYPQNESICNNLYLYLTYCLNFDPDLHFSW